MNPVTEKVLQRLSYERLLLTPRLRPQKKRITLEEVIEAGKAEPRIYLVLPAILIHNPKIIYRVDKDLKGYPKVKELLKHIYEQKYAGKKYFGMEVKEYLQNAKGYKKYLDNRRSKNKLITKTFRFSNADVEMLNSLTEKLETGSYTATIRVLLREKSLVLSL